MAKPFTDGAGRQWEVRLSVTAVKRVKDLLAVDLLTVMDGELLTRLAGNPVLLADVLYAVIKPQADAAGVSDEQFGESLAGDVIEQATNVLLAELTDFFQKGQRQILQRMLAKIEQLEASVAKEVLSRIDDGRIEKRLAQELAKFDAELETGYAAAGGSMSGA